MALANNRPHLLGWLLLGILSFLQSPGRTFADTKHDLAANPAGFLSGALHAWSDVFPLGQLQNQAYGYLFPQGLFFLVTDFLPDWVAQRLWWWVVLGVGFSGALVLLRRAQIGTPSWRLLGAALYALSPHTISTLGAISSETWPMMLSPWALAPLVGRRPLPRDIAASVVAVACMGAVNATATAAACLPAAIALLIAKAWRPMMWWLAGCAAVSLWWVGPLLVLGRYSPPFTDFIENSYVTTRWLNLVELLRGTSSWAPFADSERLAGTLLATSPYFVILTAAVAVLGLVGLQQVPQRRLWLTLLFGGILIMSSAPGPVGDVVLAFLDGAGAPLRNVHKFDVLVRLPLMVGLVQWVSTLEMRDRGRRQAVAALVCVLAVTATAPAWSGRLGPKGGYEAVPDYWLQAAQWLNDNARGTRTVILPESSVARQDWGWTRDEPLQPLLDVPWVVRDAVPLVPPEAIRGLDGLMAHPSAAGFSRLGIGAAVIRHDLAGDSTSQDLSEKFREEGFPVHSFGRVDIVEFDLQHAMHLSSKQPLRVAGGGESLALLDDVLGPHTYDLVAEDATVVTDTPQWVSRNYGAVKQATSAPLARAEEGADVRNRVPDYPSRGPRATITEGEVHVRASSSAADATAFGGAQPARSVTAAVDGSPDTAWYPAPGKQEGESLTFEGTFESPALQIRTVGAPVVLTISSGSTKVNKVAHPGQLIPVELPMQRATDITITLGAAHQPVGIAEVTIEGHDVSRILEVPNTSPNVEKFLFQRLFPETGRIHRLFTAPRDMTVTVTADSCDDPPATANPTDVTDDFLLDGAPLSCVDTFILPAGRHELSTTARWISLTTPDFSAPPAPTPIAGDVPAATEPQILVTGRAFNPGLRATVGGQPVTPLLVDADTQAFHIPADVHGPIELSFVGDRPYRISLFSGLFLALLTVLGCLVLLRLPARQGEEISLDGVPRVFGALVIVAVGGWWALLAGALAALILRYTLITHRILAALGMSLAGLWLAHAPWPSESYAGDHWFVSAACALSLWSLVFAPGQRLRRDSAGNSRK